MPECQAPAPWFVPATPPAAIPAREAGLSFVALHNNAGHDRPVLIRARPGSQELPVSFGSLGIGCKADAK